MNNILMVGLSTYDFNIPMKGALIENQKYHLKIEHKCGGGPAFNAACLCARWGANTYLRSCLGTDQNGVELADIANEYGVHPDELLISNDCQTSYSHVYINTENGNRTIMNFRGAPEDHHHFFEDKDIDVILTDGHEPTLTMDAFAQYPDAVKILDAGNFREPTLRVAREVDYIACSRVFAEGYTRMKIDLSDWDTCVDIFEKMEKVNHKQVVITLGEDGLLYRYRRDASDEGRVMHMPAYYVEAVDTNGAGDIFHGAFAFGILKGLDLETTLRMAQMTAAISVQTIGSQSSIPELQTVWDELRKRPM